MGPKNTENMELSKTNYTKVRILLVFSSLELIMSIAGIFHQRLPLVTTDPRKLEDQAKSVLKPTAYSYVAGGAGERAMMDANRLAFR